MNEKSARRAGKLHLSVMPDEVVEWLNITEGDTVLDGTLGLGGHSEIFCSIIGKSGHLIGLDRDENALEKAGERLSSAECRVDLLHYEYSRMNEAIAELGLSGVDRILLDIGVSSMQLDFAERGFSFMREGPLDMRMDGSKGQTAEDVVMKYSEDELERIFREYGEERFSGKVARMIVEERRKGSINTTSALTELVKRAVRTSGKIHPATRVFQALRIEVNDELGELERGIEAAVAALNPNGRLVLLTFHSLEDRCAKYKFRELAERGLVTLPRKKVVMPSYKERQKNRRARSAKLRVLEKN